MKKTTSTTETVKKTAATKKTAPTTISAATKPASATPEEKTASALKTPADKIAPVVKEPVFRYSDEELNEFKTLINDRLDKAREELNFLQGQMLGKGPNGQEDSADLRLSLEDGSGAMDREQLSQLTSRQVMYISNLEKALIRIHNKTYGVCRETGKLIDKARLRAVPHATLSIEAKNGALKGK